MSKKMKIINLAVFCTWIALLSLLLYRQQTGSLLEKPAEGKAGIEKAVYWYDIYAGKEKIGFASTVFDRVGDEIIIRHEREMKVIKDGKETVLFDRVRCLNDLSLSIKSFEYTSHFKDEEGIKLTGKVDSGEVIFFLESAKKRKTHKTSTMGRPFYLPVTFVQALVQKRPVPGSAYTVPLLDFNSLSIMDVKVSLEEIRPIKVGTNIQSFYKFKAGGSVWWSNERGMIVKEENPIGFTLYAQAESFAKDPSGRILFDYTSLPFMKADRLIQNVEGLKRFKVRIRGFRLDPKIYENSPVTLRGDVLAIEGKDAEYLRGKTYSLPYEGNISPEYLSSDQWVLSDSEPFKNTGRIYARSNGNDAYRLVNYLTGYVFNLVRTMPMFVLSDSMSFLKSLSGDYPERSVMFASYARAAGLPVRLVSGLVYRDGYFYYHTWPEVWFDKWIPVDPTLAQFPADVTHIPLKEGTLKDIVSITDALKDIRIEILEAS